jgi:hypothetical protein
MSSFGFGIKWTEQSTHETPSAYPALCLALKGGTSSTKEPLLPLRHPQSAEVTDAQVTVVVW